MTTIIVPVTIESESARLAPADYSIVISEAEVVVTDGEVTIMTAEVHQGFIYGVQWTLPLNQLIPASARSTLIGRVQQHVLIAEAHQHT